MRTVTAPNCAALLLFAVCAGSTAIAQPVPERMVFQGRLLRADGQPETTAQTLRFALYDAATGGTALWTETHANVPVQNGFYTVELGSKTPLAGVFTGAPRFMSVSLENQSEMLPRLPISSLPYAFKAGDSERLGGEDKSAFASASHGHPTATTSAAGFLSSSDKAKLDDVPTVWGDGLTQATNNGVSRVDVEFGGSGASSLAARADHSHALPKLSCTNRTATAPFNTGATANCLSGEEVTGGGCEDVPTGAGFTITAMPTTNGYLCRGGGSTPPSANVTAHAICCKVVP